MSNSHEWQKLVAAAVLGTDRVGDRMPSIGGPAGAILSAVQAEAAPAKLLHSASALGLYELAGRESRGRTDSQIPALEEDLGECTIRAGRQLDRILNGDSGILFDEWCTLVAARHQRVPDEHLPSFLDRCVDVRNLTPQTPAKAVLGHRGKWLARRSTRWRRLAFDGDPRETWHTGEPEERWAALASLRALDPEAGRSMIVETWAEEEPDDRAKVLKLLATGLSQADEEFLEGTLDDKRKAVRVAAADLLARLPSSSYRNRMLERARAMVKLTPRKGLMRGTKLAIDVLLPEKVDASMTRDGIENKRRHGMGNKANVLCQVLAGADLDAMESDVGQDPGDLVRAAKASEWKEPLLRGWIRAAIRQHDARWAEALLRASPGEESVDGEALEQLVGCLSEPQHETLALEWLSQKPKLKEHPVMAVLCGSRCAWSAELSRAVLRVLQRYFGTNDTMYEHALRKTVVQRLAPLMSPEIAAEAADGWKRKASGWHKGNEEMVEALVATLMFRREMYEE